jgi:hypothetical protein
MVTKKPIVQSLWIGPTLTNLEILCINSFIQNGYDFHLYTYGPIENVPPNTIIKDGTEILPKDEIYCYQSVAPGTHKEYKTSPSAFSNIFRFTLIYKKGGTWVDTDICCLPEKYDFSVEPYTFISETNKTYQELKFGASIVSGRKGDPIFLDAINMCRKRKQMIMDGKIPWGLGPATIKYIVEKYDLHKYVKPWYFANSCNCHHVESIMNPFYIIKDSNPQLYRHVVDVKRGSHFIHLWNEFWRRRGMDKNDKYSEQSLYEELKAIYLPKELELGPTPKLKQSVSESAISTTSSKESSSPSKKDNKKKWKVCITMNPVDSAWGGGNQFARNLIKYLEKKKNFDVVFELEDDVSLIFVMDPRKLKYNKITLEQVKKFKIIHPDVKVIHRVNDCDKPRDQVNVLDPIMFKAFKQDDLVVFVSEWTKQYYMNKGFSGFGTAINNGCNQKHFKPNTEKRFDKTKIKIVTHHWSDNWNKGFEYYEKMDQYIDDHPEISMTFIGRGVNTKYKPKNIKVIGPFHGTELGSLIADHDIYMTASKWENCPMHVIEGLSCGLPILYDRNLGGGVEVAERHGGEGFSSFEELVEKLNKIVENYDEYVAKIDYSTLSSEYCSKNYYSAMYDLMINKLKKYKVEGKKIVKKIDPERVALHPVLNIIVPPVKNEIKIKPGTPDWISKVVNWMNMIEKKNYRWSIIGNDNVKLSATSLFAKLAYIYQDYYSASKGTIRGTIMKYMQSDGLYLDVPHEQISESRQAIVALINLDFNVPIFTVEGFYDEPLYFMSEEAWENPWKAGAHLSHYLFFMKQLDRQDKITDILHRLKKFEHDNGWYWGNPSSKWLINGIMKVFTGFDIIGKKVESQMAINIIDYMLRNKETSGGCSIYDYVYAIVKCLETVPEYRYDECRNLMIEIAVKILDHQQEDGGFKYDNTNDRAHKFYGQDITPNGMIGSIHGTTLFSMALAKIDKHFNIGLGLHLPIS